MDFASHCLKRQETILNVSAPADVMCVAPLFELATEDSKMCTEEGPLSVKVVPDAALTYNPAPYEAVHPLKEQLVDVKVRVNRALLFRERYTSLTPVGLTGQREKKWMSVFDTEHR